MSSISKLDVWKEYESISMHFNTLLIQLRIRALGGIGVVAAVLGFVSKSDTSQGMQWTLIAYSMLALFFIWLAIFLIDVFYYNKLLLGAVSATIDLESNTDEKIDIKFSTSVKDYVEGKSQKFDNLWPIYWFYGIVGFLLISSSLYSFSKICNA